MEEVRPFYKKMLVATIVVYVIGTSLTLANLCYKIGQLEHTLWHLSEGHNHPY